MKPCEAWAVFANATGEVRYIDIREHVCNGWRSGDQSVARVLITEGWRPIAEAPKDGVFQVWLEEPMLGSNVHTANWKPNVKTIGGIFAFDAPKPLYFMPLPAPPVDRATR